MEILRGARRSFASALVAIFVLASAAAALSACNTARGFGEDMSAAGHAVANTAQRVTGGQPTSP